MKTQSYRYPVNGHKASHFSPANGPHAANMNTTSDEDLHNYNNLRTPWHKTSLHWSACITEKPLKHSKTKTGLKILLTL